MGRRASARGRAGDRHTPLGSGRAAGPSDAGAAGASGLSAGPPGVAVSPETPSSWRNFTACYQEVVDALNGREKGRPWEGCFFGALKWAALDVRRGMIRDVKRVERSVPLGAPEITESSQDQEIAPDLDVLLVSR